MKTRFIPAILALVLGSLSMAAQPRGAAPQPITDGLKDAYKDYFMIGVAVNQRNVTVPEQVALVKREFNSITAENDMKPQPTEPRKGEFNWEGADRIADFCRENGIKLRGHCLMWHSQVGEWIYRDEKGNLLPKEQFYANMKHHIQAVVNRYKDVVYAWDVVNEAVADNPVRPGQSPMRQSPMFQIAGEEFIYKAFEYAHEADPNALLFYNDYNEADPQKSQRIYDLVKRMKDAGVPVHGIGMQGHYNIYSPLASDVEAAIVKYAELVDHIHVTELDIRVNTEMGGQLNFSQGSQAAVSSWEQTLQQDQYESLFRVFRKHADVIDCVTFWNVSDRDSWLGVNNSPLLFDANYQPKRAYSAVKGFNPALDNAVVLEDFVPSTKNQPGQQYPMVNSQGYVRLRIDAPKANSVICTLGGGTVLHKGADGFWTATTKAPEDEGFHYYHLIIDGGVFNDPGTGNFYGSTRWESGVEIPAHDQDFYAVRNVPHGKVEQVLFWSESTSQYRTALVYTPPTYDSSKRQKYPVLYLQHGWGENETSWSIQGHANLIMDNMIAAGEIQPFIVVMTYGMTNDVRIGGLRGFNYKDFEAVLCDELVPYIDSHYRTKADRNGRAMAGLSMGGMETHSITLARPGLFGYWGLLSGGTYNPDEIKDPSLVKGIFMGCGSKENPDGVNRAAEALRAAGFNAKSYVSEGTAHEFLTWRRCLKEMAPMLFK
ncbi:MAG: endo-1,4-beta-xylanase [Bacteroidales bacterium]|nr:endo-1,4-beta-xylanase [Bacteroidales bacterium]